MSVKEVSALRKTGNLDEAMAMAVRELQQDPENPWTQMSVFWVLRDLCLKIYIPNHEIAKYQEALAWMQQLLPTMMDDSGIGKKALEKVMRSACPHAGEIMEAADRSKTDAVSAYLDVKEHILKASDIDVSLHEGLGWILFRYLKAESPMLGSVDVRRLLRDYMYLDNERPSMLHSNILNFALNFSKGNADFSFCRFFKMWGPINLRPEDFVERQIDGHVIPSLVARICRAMVESGEDFDWEDICRDISNRKDEVLEHLQESCFWHVFNLFKGNRMQDACDFLANYIARFAHYGPSSWNSEILKIAERYLNNQNAYRFLDFFKEWNFRNFMPEDWKETVDKKGYVYKSLAVKAAKKCFAVLKGMQNRKKELVEWLLEVYQLVVQHVRDEWIVREFAILNFWLGDFSNAASLYRDLLLQMSDKFYIWNELSQCIKGDDELKIALLCKSLLLERNEKFLGDIHLHLAEVLIRKNLLREANNELCIYKENREEEAWALSPLYHQLVEKIGMVAEPVNNNRAFYQKHVTFAEEYAFADVESQVYVLVDRLQKERKSKCVFCGGKQKFFQVNAKRFEGLAKAELGSSYSVRCIESNEMNGEEYARNQKKYIPLSMKALNKDLWDGFPIRYGYISYINVPQKIMTLITPDFKLVFCPIQEKKHYKKGDFVSFHGYEFRKKYRIAQICHCKRSEALLQYPATVVVVDNVNVAKELFHYNSDVDGVNGVVHFKDVAFKLKKGDLLKVHYCLRKEKDGKKRCELLEVILA